MIVWSLAGLDPSGGAGLAADLRAFEALGVHGCAIACALTAQNSAAVTAVEAPSAALVRAQIQALAAEFPASAFKTGMLASAELVAVVAAELERLKGPLVCDPVLAASSGRVLMDTSTRAALVARLFPRVDLLTPNLIEVEALTGIAAHDEAGTARAAAALRALGPHAVLIKGGHSQGDEARDFFSDGQTSFWLTSPRHRGVEARGTGCTLAAAIAALLARGEHLADAVVLAKGYLNRALHKAPDRGLAPRLLGRAGLPNDIDQFPLRYGPSATVGSAPACPPIEDGAIGFYPILDSLDWLRRMLPQGLRTVQFRVKHLAGAALERELAEAIALCRAHGCRLFINDHWREAIQLGAYGVHLGQEDLDQADVGAIAAAGLRLGLSTHGAAEVARALAYRPSYLAVGPVFPTTSKQVEARPRGLDNLAFWCALLPLPVVAIGGIALDRADAVRRAGASGCAVISALTAAADPEAACRAWLQCFPASA